MAHKLSKILQLGCVRVVCVRYESLPFEDRTKVHGQIVNSYTKTHNHYAILHNF